MSRLMHLPVTATTTLMAATMNLLTNMFERLGRFDNDEGTTTIEYAMAALAAAALAGVLYVIVTSPTVHDALQQLRSEERRVGKECRSRWSPYH